MRVCMTSMADAPTDSVARFDRLVSDWNTDWDADWNAGAMAMPSMLLEASIPLAPSIESGASSGSGPEFGLELEIVSSPFWPLRPL